MSCCDNTTTTLSVAIDELIVGDHVQTSNAKLTTATAYARGDLLILSATNVLTLAIDPAIWDVISTFTFTAAEATARVAAGFEAPVYNQGEFNVALCSLGGVKLTAGAQQDQARAHGTIRNIELRKVV
ncbi:MAG TPA: hypothetical protein VIH30_01565 [Aquirhabdus sp.]